MRRFTAISVHSANTVFLLASLLVRKAGGRRRTRAHEVRQLRVVNLGGASVEYADEEL